jgi:RNA polymerase sigma factor (sigma-70 family)
MRYNAMSFETLLARLSPTLKKITRKLNGHFSFMDDQDLFQEALLHLWTRFIAGDLTDKTDSYLLQGCYYHLKNYIRRTQDSTTVVSLNGTSEDEGQDLEETLVAHDVVSYDEVEGDLQIEAIVASGMNQREKEVLFYSLDGMTTREIGVRLGVSHVSVVKARNKIKEHYTKLHEIRGIDVANRVSARSGNGAVASWH